MRFIIEVDGAVMDVEAAWYCAHCDVARAVGWSWLDSARFWRLIRKEGRGANVLPASKPHKLAEYQARFAERIESDEIIALFDMLEGAVEDLAELTRFGTLHFITTGRNVAARRKTFAKDRSILPTIEIAALDPDVRRRPGELKALARGDRRTLVVGAGDDVMRAAREAEILAVGVSCGPCIAGRLHQGGADVVYGGLDELVESLLNGAHDLIRAGLLPPRLG